MTASWAISAASTPRRPAPGVGAGVAGICPAAVASFGSGTAVLPAIALRPLAATAVMTAICAGLARLLLRPAR